MTPPPSPLTKFGKNLKCRQIWKCRTPSDPCKNSTAILSNCHIGTISIIHHPYMDTIPQDRSHLRGTGPSSYGTGPILFNKIGPVPNWTFSWINTILSLIWARSHGFLLIFAPTISPFSAVQLYKKQYKLLKINFYSWNVDFRVIWDQWHHQLA